MTRLFSAMNELAPTLRRAYTWGDCWVLATELHRLTDWQVCVIAQGTELDPARWSHMFVRTPDAAYLDISGISTEADLLTRYGVEGEENFLATVPAGRLHAFTSAQTRFYPSLKVAPTALRLLSAYRELAL